MQSVKIRPHVDSSLEHLALVIERNNAEISVVLHADGVIIVGRLIGQRQYIDLHHETLKKMLPRSEENLTAGRDLAIRQHEYEVVTEAPPVLILKDVRIIEGRNRISIPLWRVRIEAVSGWYYGSLPDEF